MTVQELVDLLNSYPKNSNVFMDGHSMEHLLIVDNDNTGNQVTIWTDKP